MASHRKLKAWEHCRTLAVVCIRASRAFPLEEQHNLADQLRRAATSAALNVAEGASRSSYRDYRKFLDIARSSVKEVEAILEIAHHAGYLSPELYVQLEERTEEAAKTLYGLLRYVEGRIQTRAANRLLPPPT
jgi:four helix bundle protein